MTMKFSAQGTRWRAALAALALVGTHAAVWAVEPFTVRDIRI